MPTTSQAEWLNENSLRAYPFRENSTRIPSNSSGTLMGPEYALPNYLIVDAILSVPYMDNIPELFISSVTLVGGVITVVVSSYDGWVDSPVGSATVKVSKDANSVVEFVGSGNNSGVRGAIVFGDTDRFSSNYPDGVFQFVRDQTMLEARCVRPSAQSVSSIRTSSGSYMTKKMIGDVALIAGENVRLTYLSHANAIRIDVDSNAGYNEACDCGDGAGSTINMINGVSVNDLTIEGDECISVETSNGKITIKDTCSKPCAGCEELNFVNTKANEIVTAYTRLSAFAASLALKLDEFKTNFLDSERSPIHQA